MIELNNSQLNLISNKIQTGFKTLVDKKHREQGHITEEDLQLLNIAAENLWYAKYRAQSTESEKSNLGNILSKLGISQEDAESIFKDIDAVITGLIPSPKVATATEAPAAAAPAAAPTAAPAAAAPAAAAPAAAKPSSSDLFSELLVKLIKSNNVQTAQTLISKIQNSTKSTGPNDLPGTLQELLGSEDPSQAIERLSQATLFALKQELNKSSLNQESAKLINALFQHGPFVNYYIQSSLQERQVFDNFLKDMSTATEEPTRNLDYLNTLNSFKDELSTTMRQFHEAKAKVSNLPARLQASTLRTTQIELNKGLAKLNENFQGKIAKLDLEAITTTLSEIKESTDTNPQAKNKLNEWTQKIFTAEGAVAATMLVPFLANILAGTLGDLPLVGGMIKSLAGLSSTIASSAQGLIQMLNTLNQTKTAEAVARLQGNSQTPKQD